MKYGAVLHAMGEAEAALEENEEGQWFKRRREVEREVARRVPEFQVVVAFSQQKAAERLSDGPSHGVAAVSLLAECSQRLIWLYHRWLPELVAEGHFDVGKLLHNLHRGSEGSSLSAGGLSRLRQLHVLRLLQESEQFSLMGKTG